MEIRRPQESISDAASVVVLIERNEKISTLYSDALRGAGFTVVVAPDTTAALYALTEITPHIVIASFDRRTHDECFALCERLRADSRTQDIPILLTSAGISAKDLERATGISVLGLSVGPHDDAKMISAVRGVLAVTGGRASLSPPEPIVSRSASANE